MNPYSSLCDDFYINMNLGTEMELPTNRETVLHFFERVQKTYPTMRNFYCRDRGDFVLEEDKDKGNYRWCTIEPRRVCSGQVNPASIEGVLQQHDLVLELAPYMLSVSPLDCEALDLLYGFDFTYRGNQNQLVAEALGVSPAMERMVEIPGATVINCEPSLTVALDEECRHAVSPEHRDADQRLPGPHRRLSGRAAQRVRHRPAVWQPWRRTPTFVDTLQRLEPGVPGDVRPPRDRAGAEAAGPDHRTQVTTMNLSHSCLDCHSRRGAGPGRVAPGFQFGPRDRGGKAHGLGPRHAGDDVAVGDAPYRNDVCGHPLFLAGMEGEHLCLPRPCSGSRRSDSWSPRC